jgi:hypothetical protein
MLRIWIALGGAALVGCGGSFQAPNERLASSEAALRSAQELGAAQTPQASLHAQLAKEEIDRAKKLMADGDNKRADFVLQRASADAELAVLLAKETTAKNEADQVADQVRALQKK